jgi:hypothetical protein
VPKIGIGRLEVGQQVLEGEGLGIRHGSDRIEAGQDESFLGLGEFNVGDGHVRLAATYGELDAQVSVDDMSGRQVDENLRHPAHLGQRTG